MEGHVLEEFLPEDLVSLWPCDAVFDGWTNDKAIIERQRAKKVTHLPPLIGALMSLFLAGRARQVVALVCTAARSWCCASNVFIEARSAQGGIPKRSQGCLTSLRPMDLSTIHVPTAAGPQTARPRPRVQLVRSDEQSKVHC